MRALEPEVVDVIWAAVEPMLPARPVRDPGRGHRPRIPDRLCFWGILVRLATGCSWQCAEALLGWQVSDTTLRSRRDEWVAAGVFELIAAEAIAAYDRIVGLDLDDVCVDGSTHKAPCGGEGTGKSPVDRRKSGWKRSIATDGARIPVAWAAAGANRNDIMLFDPKPLPRSNDKASITTPRPCTSTADTGAPASTGQPPLRASPTWCGAPQTQTRPRRPRRTGPSAAGAALARRANQLMAVQLRPAATKHRPKTRAPPRPARPRRHPHHRHQTHIPTSKKAPASNTSPQGANCAPLACAVLAHNIGHWTNTLADAPPATNRSRRTDSSPSPP